MAIRRIRRKSPRKYYTSSQIRKWIPLFTNKRLFNGIVQPPFKDDLSFDLSTRSDLTLVDNISADNAAVVGGVVGVFSAAYAIIDRYVVGSNDISLEFSLRFNDVTTGQVIFSCGGYSALFKGFRIRVASGVINVVVADGTTSATQISTSGLLTDTDYVIKYNWNGLVGGAVTLDINGSVTNATATVAWTGNSYQKCLIGSVDGASVFLDGEVSCFYLDNITESNIYFNGHTYDSITGVEATNNGVTFTEVTDYTPASTLEALDSGYYELSTGEQVINPQFTLPVGATQYEGGQLHNFIESYIDLQPSDAAMTLETELVVNGGFDTDTDWITEIGWTISDGKANFDGSGSGTSYQLWQEITTDTSKLHLITFDVSGSNNGGIDLRFGSNVAYANINLINGRYNIYTYTQGVGSRLSFEPEGFIGSIDNESVKQIPTKYELFNRANTTIYNQTARDSVYYDSSNPFLFHSSEMNIDTIDSYLNTAYKERFYQRIRLSYCDQDYIDRIFAYDTQKTGSDAVQVHNYIGNSCRLLTDESGEQIYDSNNLPVWED